MLEQPLDPLEPLIALDRDMERLATKAQLRKDQAVAEGKSLDDAVKQSIKLHGP